MGTCVGVECGVPAGRRAAWRAARLLLPLVLTLQGQSAWAHVTVDRAGGDTEFRAELDRLAARCDEVGLAAEASITRSWFVQRDPRRHYLFLPLADDPTRPAAGAALPVRQWHAEFAEIRGAQARRLFVLAQQAADAGDEPAAYRLLHEVLHEDPQHAEARRVLGYVRLERGWQRPARKDTRRRNRTAHPLFGWPSNQYWVVDSQHFSVTTNLNVRAARAAAGYLERVHAAWQQLFYEYWTVPGRLAQRLAGQDASLGPARAFDVVLFKNRDEYVRQLSRAETQIEQSVGYYSREHKTAMFYAGEDAARATWVHEATHQFFQESGEAIAQVGEQSNFWVVEAVALYMESLAEHPGYVTTGGADAHRLQFARYRLLSQGFYVPLETLAGYGRPQLQRDPKLAELYSQCAGLAHGFLDTGPAEDRRAFRKYLRLVYRGAAQPPTLAAEFGQSFADLDNRYRASLDVTDADLAFVDRRARSLCLAHTQVTDAGLSQLRGLDQLTWLDFSFTSAGDAAVAPLAESPQLDQLSLEATRITPESLQVVAQLRQLEELDLSRTAIDDAALAQLANLSRLKILWLTGTQVTDAGLPALAALRNLEQLDVSDTAATDEGLAGLRKRLPNLK
ncbi:MAG: hypothetical protein MUF48_03785 [Pirellulaceae bacterium]|nr:hypothetical protein [Pirellulaceae bacterium]